MTCQISGCRRPAKVRGYCKNHYIREIQHGRIAKLVRASPMQRFMEMVSVDYDTGCHVWIGTATRPGPDGYGLFKWKSNTTRVAHRWLWEQIRGKLPKEIQLDHFRCENRRCVNLEHVRPVTPRENLLRGSSFAAANRSKTHCLRGHIYDEVNTYKTHDGKRQCRACKAEKARQRRGKLRVQQAQ